MPFCRLYLALACCITLLCPFHLAEASQEFKENNPDIGKFYFAQSYISALGYLNSIQIRWQKTSPKKLYAGDDIKVMRGYVAYLIKDNLDLRIAKNYLTKYLNADNALIRKTADTFIASCIIMIEINEKEKIVWDQWYAIKSKKFDSRVNEKKFILKQEEFALKRKEIYKGVIEATVFLSKVLKSDRNADEKGYILALTKKEKSSLLKHLDEYGKHVLDWGLKPGQDHVKASIAIIRETLEDTINTCLDE